MNKVILMGRLTRDPDIRYTQGDKPSCIARYTLAVDRRFRREGQEDTADFISCVAFGKSGEFVEKYLKKGTKVAVTGRIQTGSYVNKEGTKVYTTDVVVEDHEFAESKSAQGGNAQGGGYTQQGQQYGGQQAPQYNGQQQYGNQQQPPQYNGQQQYGNQQQAPQYNGQRAPQYGNQQQPPQYNGQQQQAPQYSDLDGFMNIPQGIDEELPFA